MPSRSSASITSRLIWVNPTRQYPRVMLGVIHAVDQAVW